MYVEDSGGFFLVRDEARSFGGRLLSLNVAVNIFYMVIENGRNLFWNFHFF